MGTVQQSGQVTPQHLAAWTTDGIIEDAGVSLANTYGQLQSTVQQINFNSGSTDNPIPINLPIGFTRYYVNLILISGATAALNSTTIGVFTQQNASGLQVVSTGTAVTISQALIDTNNNMQSLSIVNQSTLALSDTVLYFRIQTPQGSAALGNVSIFYQPLP